MGTDIVHIMSDKQSSEEPIWNSNFGIILLVSIFDIIIVNNFHLHSDDTDPVIRHVYYILNMTHTLSITIKNDRNSLNVSVST